MRGLPNSAIAQLLFVAPVHLNFARLVGEIDLHLAQSVPGGHRMGWDCDEVAWFDVGVCRLVLGRADPAPAGYAACLSIAAGPAPHRSFEDRCQLTTSDSYRFCRNLVESVQRLYEPDTVLWQEASGTLDADLIDLLLELIPARAEIESATDDAQILPDPEGRQEIANDLPDIPPPDLEALRRVRAILYPLDEAQATPRGTRSVHVAMADQLTVVGLPRRLARVAHELVEGNAQTIAARAIALAGTAFGFWQSGVMTNFGGLM